MDCKEYIAKKKSRKIMDFSLTLSPPPKKPPMQQTDDAAALSEHDATQVTEARPPPETPSHP
jgi:hypothetical protein